MKELPEHVLHAEHRDETGLKFEFACVCMWAPSFRTYLASLLQHASRTAYTDQEIYTRVYNRVIDDITACVNV